MARGFAAPLPGDPREGVHAGRERPTGPGADRRADGHLLEGDRRRVVEERARPTPGRCASPRSTTRPPRRSCAQLLAAKTPLLYVGGGVLLADAAAEMRELAEHLSLPVAHTLMGKGALPDDHPLILGMTGFWGTKFINDKCKGADWILAPRHALLRGRLQLVGGQIHVQLPADEADPHRHRSGRDRPQLPGGDRRRRRPQGSAQGAEPRRPQDRAQGRAAAEAARARWRRTGRRSSPGTGRRCKATRGRCVPSGSWPTCAKRCRAMR